MIFEPINKWVRVELNNFIVADSTRVMLLIENSRELNYYFPIKDVLDGVLLPSDYIEVNRVRGKRKFWHVKAGDRLIENGAWTYETVEGRPNVSEMVGFIWNKMDHWYEEEEEVFNHPRNPYHRVDYLKSSRHVEVFIDDLRIADSKQAVFVFETEFPVRYYLPFEDVKNEFLIFSDYFSFCSYKGRASYFNVLVGDELLNDIVWFYLEPNDEALRLKGTIAFRPEKAPGRIQILVDGEEV